MKMNKSLLPFVIILFIPFTLCGQGNDFGIWAGITGKHEFSKRFDAELILSMRTTENTSVLDQYFAEGGISYKIVPLLSAGGSVRLINKFEDDSRYHFRQKFYFNLKSQIPVGRFAFSGRITFQRAVRKYVEDAGDQQAENYLRFKLKAGYEAKTSPFRPFVSFEPFFPLWDENKRGIEKTRTSAGTEVKITRKTTLEAAFLLENFTKEGKAGKNILLLGLQKVF